MTNDRAHGSDAQHEPDDTSAVDSQLADMIAADKALYAMSFIDASDADRVPDVSLLDDEDGEGFAAEEPIPDPQDDLPPKDGQGERARAGRRRVLPDVGDQVQGVLPWLGSRTLDGLSVAGFHVVRSPWYMLRGLRALVVAAGRWVLRREDDEVFAAQLGQLTSVRGRQQKRAERVRGRMARLAVSLSPLGAVWAWVEHGSWGLLPAVACAGAYVGLSVGGWRSVEAGKSSHEKAARRRKRQPLSRPFVTEALEIVDCGAVKRPSGEVAGPVILSASPVRGGEVMVIDLPAGVPVSKLVKKQEELAGALGRPAECVVIEPQPKVSPGRFELFVAAKRLDETGAPSWPWAKVARRSFFEGVPVGVDARGREVRVPLFESHGLVAGAMGMGKSYSARLLLLGAALDPRVTLLIHNLKGGPDYRAFGPVAHTLRSGSSAADLDALEQDLAWMQAEIGRRGRVLEQMPSDQVPEGKLTDAIASQDGMGPVVLLIDEAQRAFVAKQGDAKRGERIAAMLEDVERTGRSVGFHVELVTQGTKSGAIPSGILDQLVHRIGHGVTSISDANLTLGSDAHGRTYRAVDIDTPGIAYVGAAGGKMVKTAMAKVDLPEVERIVLAAAELRRREGTLSGMAAGEVEADEHDGGTDAFLSDVLGAWPSARDGKPRKNATSVELAELLVACDPGEYDGLEGAEVSRRMTGAGVKVSSQRIQDAPDGRGVKLADVRRAASASGGQ